MDDMICAPQWTDFTASPQLPSDSYFEIEHEVHEPQIHARSNKSNMSLPCNAGAVKELFATNAKCHSDPKTITSTPIKVAYFVPCDNKKQPLKETANDNTLRKAMTNLKLEEKPRKVNDTWNLSAREFASHGVKTPIVVQKFKAPASEKVRRSVQVPETKSFALEKVRRSIHVPETKSTVLGDSSLKYTKANNGLKQKENIPTILTKDKNELTVSESSVRCPERVKVDLTNRRLSYKIVSLPRRKSNTFKSRRTSLGRSQPKVLTCQYRRRSLLKYRRRSNQFISLAEAVSKFQNGTPQRFRTMSNKPGPLLKMKRAPLKLTYPVSPALRCKQRVRQTTVLSQQEREALELQEMRKNQIKANPVPVNILKAPCALKKVTKKPVTVAAEFHLTRPKRTRHTTGPLLSPKQASDSKEQGPSNGTVKKANNLCIRLPADNVKSVTRALPFSFEARNKEFQVKKEQKLKNLQIQETSKVKAEFHARPVPNFSKSTNPVKEPSVKRAVVPCPFSFEIRDKNLAKKKEEHVKQMQEENKKTRIFHANPVPSFKPVIVHGVSKENLRAKEKAVDNSKKPVTRHAKSFIDQENKPPNIVANTTICVDTKKREVKRCISNNDLNKKQSKSIANTMNSKEEKSQADQKKPVKIKVASVELNTDKRAKERCEFDEKIRRKEQEEEAKRQEEEKNRLMREKMEKAELRKMAEVKARPMPVYKPLVLMKSTKLLTSPKSPALGCKNKPKRVN